MSYTIKLSLVNETTDSFSVVNGHPYNGQARWFGQRTGFVLQMDNSGTCGILIFESSVTGKFALATGVHNYKRWVHTNLKGPFDDPAALLERYFTSGTEENDIKWKQWDWNKTPLGKEKKVSVYFYENEGKDLRATIEYYPEPK